MPDLEGGRRGSILQNLKLDLEVELDNPKSTMSEQISKCGHSMLVWANERKPAQCVMDMVSEVGNARGLKVSHRLLSGTTLIWEFRKV